MQQKSQYEREINMQKAQIQKLQEEVEKARISSPNISSINTSSYNDTCRFSGFVLGFPNIAPGSSRDITHKYIKIKYNISPIVKPKRFK